MLQRRVQVAISIESLYTACVCGYETAIGACVEAEQLLKGIGLLHMEIGHPRHGIITDYFFAKQDNPQT